MHTNGRGEFIALVGGISLVAAVALGAGFAITQFGFFGRVSPAPKPSVEVKAIPIPAASCPYLRVVRVGVNRAGEGWADAIGYSPTQWARFAKQLAPKLATFELALRVAIPHVPRAVSRDLRFTLQEVRDGRVHLRDSRDFDDYTAKTHWAVLGGFTAMTHANQLVGRACGGLRIPDLGIGV